MILKGNMLKLTIPFLGAVQSIWLLSFKSIGHCPRFCVNRKLEDSSFILESCFQI